MAEEPRQPRNFKDRALIWISGLLVGGHVPLVADSPRLMRVVDRQLFVMAPSEQETDRTFLAEDGSIWSFEFQFRDSEADVARMAGYHLTLLRQYPGRVVETVIFWGHRPPSEEPLRLARVIFHPRQVFLQALLAETELGRWRRRAEEGPPLGRAAALELVLLPLMRHTLGMRKLLEAALPVTEWLEPDLRAPTRAAMLCLGYGEMQSPTDRAWARLEVLNVPVVGQELFEDLVRDGLEKGLEEGLEKGRVKGLEEGLEEGLEKGLEKGRHDGEVRQAQKAVLEAFTARFDDPPATLREAVTKTDDLTLLTQWLRAVVRAPDATSAEAAVVGAH